jgi:hypothetical protein
MLIFSIITLMKRILLTLLLLVNWAPVFAGESDGDPGYMPSYRELVREGYGPRHYDREDYYLRLGYGLTAAPKPTQAYYGKGYTIYYGYTAVPVPWGRSNAIYAFGHPVEYYRHLLPESLNGIDLSRYAVEVPNGSANGTYGPGDYVAQRREHRADAVTTVQSVKTTTTTTTTTSNGTNPLPAVGEKPAH